MQPRRSSTSAGNAASAAVGWAGGAVLAVMIAAYFVEFMAYSLSHSLTRIEQPLTVTGADASQLGGFFLWTGIGIGVVGTVVATCGLPFLRRAARDFRYAVKTVTGEVGQLRRRGWSRDLIQFARRPVRFRLLESLFGAVVGVFALVVVAYVVGTVGSAALTATTRHNAYNSAGGLPGIGWVQAMMITVAVTFVGFFAVGMATENAPAGIVWLERRWRALVRGVAALPE